MILAGRLCDLDQFDRSRALYVETLEVGQPRPDRSQCVSGF